MYRARRGPTTQIKAQLQFFRLKPLPPISYGVSSEESDRKLSKEQVDTDQSMTKCQSRVSDVSSYSARSTPLPVLQDRKPTERVLLRRPSMYKAEPLKRHEALFDVLAKMTEFKLLQFQKATDSYKFYLNHYPLILQKEHSGEHRTVTPPTRRDTISPDSPMSIMVQRKANLNKRLTDLEAMVDDMENETESDDVPFRTELRSSVFDPTSWPFAKVDHKCMLRRFTIDAVLRDLNKY